MARVTIEYCSSRIISPRNSDIELNTYTGSHRHNLSIIVRETPGTTENEVENWWRHVDLPTKGPDVYDHEAYET